jgi:hypothetical protein
MRTLLLTLTLTLFASGYAPLSLAAELAPDEQKVPQLEALMPQTVAHKQAEPTQQPQTEPEAPRQKCTYGHTEPVDL